MRATLAFIGFSKFERINHVISLENHSDFSGGVHWLNRTLQIFDQSLVYIENKYNK